MAASVSVEWPHGGDHAVVFSFSDLFFEVAVLDVDDFSRLA